MKSSFQLEINNEEQQLKVARIVQRAAEMTHCAFTAKQKVDEIAQTIACGEKVRMWEALQRYLREYHDFIVGTSLMTNLTVIPLPADAFASISEDFLKKQLRLLRGYVYAYHALNCAGRIAFQECLSNLLRVLAK